MQALQRLPLRYKFWAVNGVAFLSTLVLVLVAMVLEQRSVNQTRQEQALSMLQLWHGDDPAAIDGPIQPRLLLRGSADPALRGLFAEADTSQRWVSLSGAAMWGSDRAIGAWVSAGPGGAVRSVLVNGKSFQQIFTDRAPVYALAVFLLMSMVLIGSQLLIRFVDHYQRELQRLAHYDLLTGLPNRALARDRLDHARERVNRRGGHLAVLFIDLDRFKTLNDSHGHGFGDAVLCAVASRLQARCRQEDTLARLGGDEFLLILEQLPFPELAEQVASNLLALLERPLMIGDGREVFAGASIGIALYPGDGQSSAELIRNADAAMYRAKAQGRNTYSHYLPALTERARERFELERALRTAMAQEELRALPATDGAGRQSVRRSRGVVALAQPTAWSGFACNLCSAGRRYRPDRADRQLGIAPGVPTGPPVAGCRHRHPDHGGEPVTDSVRSSGHRQAGRRRAEHDGATA